MIKMPKIISHRGANEHCPQNTIPAFRKSVEIGVDGVENDVHMTKDGEIVLCHNYDVDETSNGTGIIRDMTLAELRALDFGVKFSDEFRGTKIPTLAEFYEVCKSIEIINVEIKRPLDGNYGIVEKTIDSAAAFGLSKQLLISSFDEETLIRVKAYDNNIKTALLYGEREDDYLFDGVAGALRVGADGIHPLCVYVDEDLMGYAHEHSLFVNPWVASHKTPIMCLMETGCDGIITDRPDFMKELLKNEYGLEYGKAL
ncbi:MAG: glycerophosphodiester phosphodiesterase [Oscillospiraceae bacterium]|nr:glycerophosphodiester phosphodiesterase [Oscillospiraceae bacterium]